MIVTEVFTFTMFAIPGLLCFDAVYADLISKHTIFLILRKRYSYLFIVLYTKILNFLTIQQHIDFLSGVACMVMFPHWIIRMKTELVDNYDDKAELIENNSP